MPPPGVCSGKGGVSARGGGGVCSGGVSVLGVVCLLWGGVSAPGRCLLQGGLVLGGLVQGGVCSPGGGGLLPWGGLVPGGSALRRGLLSEGGVPGGDSPGTATAAGGTHPTGMRSCYLLQTLYFSKCWELQRQIPLLQTVFVSMHRSLSRQGVLNFPLEA